MKETIDLRMGDCLELMKDIPDGSVDLVLTDPPYGTMKGIDDKHDWDTILDTQTMFAEISRVLRQNGKAVLFSQGPYTSNIIQNTIVSLPFCYRAIWFKNSSGNCRMAKSAMVNRFEDICIFAKPHDAENTNELRKYFAKVVEFCGGKKTITEKIGGKADHTTRIKSSQFALCTEQTYNEIISVFGIDKMDGFLPYCELARLNEKYTSTFNLWQGGKSKSNVLEYSKDNDGYHPTQKPVKLLEDLIQTYSNEGNTVLDFTMGSGSTGVACVNTERNFIGIELDQGYFDIAVKRINEAKKEKQNERIRINRRAG
jgi:site-specific DNA-methyltransferase (adenine-specific)